MKYLLAPPYWPPGLPAAAYYIYASRVMREANAKGAPYFVGFYKGKRVFAVRSKIRRTP